jgi:hypothetical protein
VDLFLSAEEDTGTADVQGGPFTPGRLPARPVTQRCSNGEPLGTRLETPLLLPRIVLQA